MLSDFEFGNASYALRQYLASLREFDRMSVIDRDHGRVQEIGLWERREDGEYGIVFAVLRSRWDGSINRDTIAGAMKKFPMFNPYQAAEGNGYVIG